MNFSKKVCEGILLAVTAYFMWGIAPAYFKLVQQVPADEILSHRIIWSFFFILLLISLSQNWTKVCIACQNWKQLLLLGGSSLLVCCNFMLYIWAVNNNQMLEASLGYFINPLVNVLLGMVFLGERLRRLQLIAVILALTGVVVQICLFGSIPTIGLGLAFSFASYGLLRKKIGIDSLTGMLIETLWLLPIAVVYLFFFADSPTSNLSSNSWLLDLLLLAFGLVTTVPLLLFTAAATRLRLSTLGFFQYISPTLVFLLAVIFYDETVSKEKLLTFGFIWGGVLLFTLDGFYTQYKLEPASRLYK